MATYVLVHGSFHGGWIWQPATPEPPFQVENLGRRAQSDPQQRLRRQQSDVVAGGAIDLDEVT